MMTTQHQDRWWELTDYENFPLEMSSWRSIFFPLKYRVGRKDALEFVDARAFGACRQRELCQLCTGRHSGYIYDKRQTERYGGYTKVNKGVGVMRDKKLNREDLKDSHTLGGTGEGDTQGEGRGYEERGLWVSRWAWGWVCDLYCCLLWRDKTRAK